MEKVPEPCKAGETSLSTCQTSQDAILQQSPKVQIRLQVPHDYAEALSLDELNGNKKWE